MRREFLRLFLLRANAVLATLEPWALVLAPPVLYIMFVMVVMAQPLPGQHTVPRFTDVPPPVAPSPVTTRNGWPFSFGETVVLIPLLTTSITGIIASLQLKKVHTLVNQASTDQKETIKVQAAQIEELKAALLRGQTETAERVRKIVEEDFRKSVLDEVRKAMGTTPAAAPSQIGGGNT